MNSPAGLCNRELTVPLGTSLCPRSPGTLGTPLSAATHQPGRRACLGFLPPLPPQAPTTRKRVTSQIPVLSVKTPSYANDVGRKKGMLRPDPRDDCACSLDRAGCTVVTCAGFHASPVTLACWVSLGQGRGLPWVSAAQRINTVLVPAPQGCCQGQTR